MSSLRKGSSSGRPNSRPLTRSSRVSPTPLRAMAGFSQALVEDYRDRLDGEARIYLDQITGSSRKMGELIDGILQLSRVTRGELRRDNVDLSALAHRILDELACSEPSRTVSWQIEPGLTAKGDARML